MIQKQMQNNINKIRQFRENLENDQKGPRRGSFKRMASDKNDSDDVEET